MKLDGGLRCFDQQLQAAPSKEERLAARAFIGSVAGTIILMGSALQAVSSILLQTCCFLVQLPHAIEVTKPLPSFIETYETEPLELDVIKVVKMEFDCFDSFHQKLIESNRRSRHRSCRKRCG